MVMALEVARLLATGEGHRLVSTIRRIVSSQGVPMEQVVRESVDHMEHLEALALRTGKTVKQVADESLALYEQRIGG